MTTAPAVALPVDDRSISDPARPGSHLGRLVAALTQWLVVGLLAFMPFAFGVNSREIEYFCLLATGVITSFWLLARALGGVPYSFWRWSYLPVFLYLALVVAHLPPLPISLLSHVSPQTIALKSDAAGAALTGSTSLTLYPDGTRSTLRVLLIPVALFFVATDLFREPRRIRHVITAIAAIGVVLVLLQLAQLVTRTNAIYWTFENKGLITTAGSFYNRGHFSQFVNLAIGAMLALLLLNLRQADESGASDRWQPAGLRQSAGLTFWMLIAGIILSAVSVVTSLSRGGAISLLVAGTVAAALVFVLNPSTRGGAGLRTGPIIAFVLLAAAAAAIWFGVDGLYARFAQDELDHMSGRTLIFRDAIRLAKQFAWFGTGFGTFQYVFPMASTSTGTSVFTHAESEYVHAFVETGIAGLSLIAWFLLTLAAHLFRTLRLARRSAAAGMGLMAIGLAMGLVAAVVQSASDFGEHLPAVAGLTAVVCGLVLNLSSLVSSTDRSRRHSDDSMPQDGATTLAHARGGSWVARASAITIALGLTLAIFLQSPDANRARLAEKAYASANDLEKALQMNGWQGLPEDFTSLIEQSDTAAKLQPKNILYAFSLANYRWRSVEQFYEKDDPAYADFAKQIVHDLLEARQLAPTHGGTVSLAGQLQYFVLKDDAGADRIHASYKLGPGDAAICFAEGRLDVMQGQWEKSFQAFQRAVTIDGGLMPAALEQYLLIGDKPELALQLVQGNPQSLLQLATQLDISPPTPEDGPAARPDLAKLAREQALALLRDRTAGSDASAEDLARLGRMTVASGDPEGAIKHYRRAIALDFRNVGYRLELVNALKAAGKTEEALKEAEQCLKLQPQSDELQKLVKDLAKVVDNR